MLNLLPKLKYLISYRNNSSYKYVLALSLIYCFNGQKKYSFEELFKFIVPFYYNMSVRYKIQEKSAGKQPKVVQNIINHSKNMHIGYLTEKDFELLSKQNLKAFFSCPLSCFEKNSKISSIEGSNTFFKYSLKENYIELSEDFHKLLSDYNLRNTAIDIVFLALVSYLEKFNNIPNLYSKISGCLTQRNLTKYKKLFTDPYSPLFSYYCLICGKKLWKDVSIDHFIPFNYIALNEIWNLIPVHKNCNSYKNDKLGSIQCFNQLVKRNQKLYELDIKNPYYEFFQQELFNKHPTFKHLYQEMVTSYNACSDIGYQVLN